MDDIGYNIIKIDGVIAKVEIKLKTLIDEWC
jgi:hypothetical protein